MKILFILPTKLPYALVEKYFTLYELCVCVILQQEMSCFYFVISLFHKFITHVPHQIFVSFQHETVKPFSVRDQFSD